MTGQGMRTGDRLAIIGIAVIAFLFAVLVNAPELLELISSLIGGAP